MNYLCLIIRGLFIRNHEVVKPISYKHLDSRKKGEYASKVKCSTLKPTHNSFGEFTSGGLMLGLKDPTDDSACEYEHKSVLVKKKRPRKERLPKDIRASEILKCREQQHMSKIQDKNTVPSTESKVTAENETNDVFDLSEQNEVNPKSFSIGSWINELFNVPSKRQPSSQEVNAKPAQDDHSIIDENSQYFKTISALKEEFRKKLRSETSIHVSNGDKPLEFDFCANDKKAKKRSKSLPLEQSLEGHVENVDDFILLEEEIQPDVLNTEKLAPVRQKYDEESLLQPYKLKSGLNLNCTSLVKEKKKAKRKNRSDIEGLEEYLTPSLSELSKGLLLNINDSEKCIQLYKNSHPNMQESQHYGQKKNKSYQSSARCYTTNTNLTEYFGDSSPKSSIKSYADYENDRICQPFSSDSPMTKSYEDSPLRNGFHESRKNSFYKQHPRKLFSEFSRDSSTFVKVRSQKSPITIPMEPGKYDTKPTSDDLVKYLMKKVKSQKHMQPKKKSSVPATIKPGVRNRIMQSATSSLVMNVIAKKESETLLPFKTGSRISIENGVFKGETLTKPLFQAKDWSSKFKDNNVVKFDIKRSAAQHRFNKNSYLSLDELEAKEIPCNKSLVKNAKRPYEDLIGSIVKEKSEKLNKRLEVKKMLLKLDAKSTSLPSTSKKYRVKKNKVSKYPSLNLRNPDCKESHELGRFHQQHELFKSAIQPCTPYNLSTSEKFFEAEGVPYEVESSDKTVQLGFDLIKANEPKGECETEEKSLMTVKANDSENSALEAFSINEKSELLCLDTDKPQTLKEKLPKSKTSFIKDDSKSILSPLMECSSNESSKQKDSANVYETPVCTPEIRPGKTLDTCLLNRRYSTNILNENKQKGKNSVHPNKSASFSTEPCKLECEGEKKDGKDKKKDEHGKKSANEEPSNCETKTKL